MPKCALTFPSPIASAAHRYTANPLRLEDRSPASWVPRLDGFGVAASAEHLALGAGGGWFGPNLEAIPDPVRVRWKKGAEFELNVFCHAIGKELYLRWPHICSRLNLKVEAPLPRTEVLQKAASRSGV